jgi:hypothetical protein
MGVMVMAKDFEGWVLSTMALFDKRLQGVIFYCSSQDCQPSRTTKKKGEEDMNF